MRDGIKPVSLDTILNIKFPNLPSGVRIPLRHFNNKREVFIYKGKNYINKTTKRLGDTNPVTMIRTLINTGTSSKPNLKTKRVFVKTKDADIFVYVDRYASDVDQDGIHLEVTNRRGGYEPYQKPFKSFMDLRKDKHFQEILEEIFGKVLFKKDK